MAIINGTPGDDDLFGTPGHDEIFGFDGNDNLFGLEGDDLMFGGDGHDFLRGGEGGDKLHGGAGDDFLRGDAGNDELDGGDGWDRATYAIGAVGGVTVSLAIQGVAQDTGSAGLDILVGIEHLTGTRFDDVLTGNDGDNWLWGGSDGSGVTGNDVISAGGGNDLVEVGAGTHSLDGGAGIDTLSLFGNSSDISADGVTFSLLLQGAAQDSEQGLMTASGFENLSGSIHDDALTGDGGDNLLAGDLGNDILIGGTGDDILYGDGRVLIDDHGLGGSGPITTFADIAAVFALTPGDDVLDGGRGDDTLNGGGGDDELTGGQGRDIFAFGPDSGDDRITDFRNNQDTIRFEGVAGVDDFSDLLITRVGRDTHITWGDGSDSILLEGVNPRVLDAGDFIFI
ncbi:MAG: calcium-binding protein [Sphingosinicella sp.]|uniref:calcium-binding protein n=1 Tax=Sphingosinicella sp. TaxID=1917971 RepID=UPI004037D570